MRDQPLFIVGTGRCGSTVLHDIVATHPRLSYLSPLCDRNPADPRANARLMGLLDVRPIEGLLRRRYYPEEVYRFWDHYAPGFSEPYRDLTAQDVTERVRRRLPGALEKTIGSRRPRLLVKITGWPRMGFFHELYPEARFIHVYRDGRAVANSTLNIWFWRGWQGESQWRWGALDAQERALLDRHDGSFVALAGLQWRRLMRAFRAARERIPSDRLLEISYEELCAAPEETIRRASDFAGLPVTDRFLRSLASFDLVNRNDKWQQDLTPIQRDILEEAVGEELEHWGYSRNGSADSASPAKVLKNRREVGALAATRG